MKERTDEEIRAKLESLWPNMEWKGGWGSKCSSIERRNGYIDLTVAKMYDGDSVPKLEFAQIDALAEFFDTMKVEIEEEIREGGCETCDYGSRYGFTVRVSPGDPYQKLVWN